MSFATPLDNAELTMHLERGKEILGHLKPNSGSEMSDWMSKINDSTPLTALSVPGTHDAAAWNFKGTDHEWWNCQNLALLDQLDYGIRALDLRYAWSPDKTRLQFYHSIALLDPSAEVEDILWGFYAWLTAHPTETIFVSLKVDNGNPDDPKIQQAIFDLINRRETKHFWVEDVDTFGSLGDARGKLVLLRRFPLSDTLLETPGIKGINVATNWKVNDPAFEIHSNPSKPSSTTSYIEDFYLLQGYPRDAEKQIGLKWDATRAHLEKASKQLAQNHRDAYITFSSAVGDRKLDSSENVIPLVMATGRDGVQGVNKSMTQWLRENVGQPIGIVFMDFIASEKDLVPLFAQS